MNSVLFPDFDCPLCPRLVSFREQNREHYPAFWNAPVPAFGELDAALLVVGLAPGLKGANATGRPFTGDYAGEILYSALQKHGFATGNYHPSLVKQGEGDDFILVNTRISNAVRCVPPQNKVEGAEINSCNRFLQDEIQAMPNLRVIITLGQVSHKAVIKAFGKKQSEFVFGHHKVHHIDNFIVINSYHTSRYNINTGVLTQGMFDEVVESAVRIIG